MFDIWTGIAAISPNREYTLIEIRDEQVPLGLPTHGGQQYFGIVIGVMFIMLVVGACAIYLMECYRCRSRITQLDPNKKVYCGWKLRRLRETIAELELEETKQLEKDVQEMLQEFFSKKIPKAEPF